MSQATDQALHTLNEFMSAVMAQNLESIMAFFHEDAQMFSPLGAFPARLDGRGAIRKQFEVIMEAFKAPSGASIKLEPQDLVARELAPNAVLFTFHLKLQGPLHRRSILLTKAGDAWRIAHIHASVASPT
ncbi:MAG TPA: nuclear transport factor 2 family protein [Candidatus Binataceae bacterium]|nr:nuclear transport factor 2 family protein [Candidatus Binataceae bacterium]